MLLFFSFDKLIVRGKTYLFRGRQYLSTVAPHMTQWLHISVSTIHLACKAHPRIHQHVLRYNHLSCYGNLVPWETRAIFIIMWFDFFKRYQPSRKVSRGGIVWLKLVTKNSDIIVLTWWSVFKLNLLWWSEFGILSSQRWNYFWP